MFKAGMTMLVMLMCGCDQRVPDGFATEGMGPVFSDTGGGVTWSTTGSGSAPGGGQPPGSGELGGNGITEGPRPTMPLPGPSGSLADAGVDVPLPEGMAGTGATGGSVGPVDSGMDPVPSLGSCEDVAPVVQPLSYGAVFDCEGTAPCDDGVFNATYCEVTLEPVPCHTYLMMWDQDYPDCIIPRDQCTRVRTEDPEQCAVQNDYAQVSTVLAAGQVFIDGWVEMQSERMVPAAATGELYCPLLCP